MQEKDFISYEYKTKVIKTQEQTRAMDMYEAFGWEIPIYMHCPPVMKDATHKLSKRNGDASYQDLADWVTGAAAPAAGTCLAAGNPVCLPKDRRVGVIRELPAETMVFSNMSYLDNLCFNLDHRFPDVWLRGRVKRSVSREYAGLLGPEVFWKRVEALTETEKYDLVYARVLLQNPQAVFCIQPFKGAIPAIPSP